MLHTFECAPTDPDTPDTQLPDELMIDWAGTPKGATAFVYLPQVDVDQIMALAAKLYGGQRLGEVDAHTVSVDANGISYVPLPSATIRRNVGLLTVELPAGAHEGSRCSATVRQVSSVPWTPRGQTTAEELRGVYRRRVTGGFRVNITIEPADKARSGDERALAFFRWMLSTLSTADRWYPVLQRYVTLLALEVDALGGNAKAIAPSPIGTVPTRAGGDHHPGHGQLEETGKIAELIFDRFGDFEGFQLLTDEGHHRTYKSRELQMAELARWAWQLRIRVTVFSRLDAPHTPDRILLHAPTSPGE